MKMKNLIMMLLLAAVLLCGCGGGEEGDPEMVDFSTAPTIPIEEVKEFPLLELEGNGTKPTFHGWQVEAENGMFLMKQVGTTFGNVLHFFDYTTGEAYPACVAPNCTHDSEDCPAYFYDGRLIHYDGEWLYYTVQEKGSYVLMRQRPDGSDRKQVFETNESGKPNVIAQMDGEVYADGILYFHMSGVLFDPETATMESGEKICALDLKTGKVTAFPYEFGDNSNSGTTYIQGMYGDNLMVTHRTSKKSLGKEAYTETWFLLNVKTQEILVLKQFHYDDKGNHDFGAYQINVAQGLVVVQINDTYVASVPVANAGEKKAGMLTGQRLVFDLEHLKGYLVTEEADLSIYDDILDGYYQHFVWNEDRTAVTPMFRDLATGEDIPMPDTLSGICWYNLRSIGDHYFFNIDPGEAENYTVAITRENFWAGDPQFIKVPEWASVY